MQRIIHEYIELGEVLLASALSCALIVCLRLRSTTIIKDGWIYFRGLPAAY